MKLIDRYVGRGVLLTALYGVAVLSVVLVLGNLFRELLDLLINRNVPLKYVFLFMLYVLPFSFTFTVPWGVLTAVLLVFGRMSADNEMIALRACGVSLRRVCLPVLAVGVLLSAFCYWINTSVAPLAEQAMRNSIATMARSNPSSLFVPDEVISQFAGKKIFIGGKDGETLKNITLIEQFKSSLPWRVILAKEGDIQVDEESGELLLTLRDAKFEQRDSEAEDDLAKIRHGVSVGEATFPIPLNDLVAAYLLKQPLRTYTLAELLVALPEETEWPRRIAMLTEISKRFSLSLACVAFALIAMPLGVTAQRKETSVGFGISLAVAFGYFFFVVLAELLREDASAFPYLLLWVPNILFIGVGTWMLMRLDHR